jgi:regulator of sigma E protease
VESVDSGSAAARAGIQPGDRLIQFAGQPVSDGERLRRAVLAAVAPVPATVERPGAAEPLQLQLELEGSPTRLGISWREDSAEPGTVVVTRVIAGSPAADAQLQTGDRIYAVAGQGFTNSEEFSALATSLASPLQLTVERRGHLEHISLNVPPPLPPRQM